MCSLWTHTLPTPYVYLNHAVYPYYVFTSYTQFIFIILQLEQYICPHHVFNMNSQFIYLFHEFNFIFYLLMLSVRFEHTVHLYLCWTCPHQLSLRTHLMNTMYATLTHNLSIPCVYPHRLFVHMFTSKHSVHQYHVFTLNTQFIFTMCSTLTYNLYILCVHLEHTIYPCMCLLEHSA